MKYLSDWYDIKNEFFISLMLTIIKNYKYLTKRLKYKEKN